MKRIRWVPGNIVAGVNITIPVAAPGIDTVVGAEIVRLPTNNVLAHAASLVDTAHAPGADVTHANMAVDPHADHPHDLVSLGTTAPPTVPLGNDAPPTQLEDAGAAAPHTFAGGGATGIQDYVTPAHVVTQPDDHPGADIAAALADHAVAASLIDHALSGVDPVVAAVPTRVDSRTITLDVDTLLGDLLSLDYFEVGERVAVA